MGYSKGSSKREVYSNTVLPQETRKALYRQPNSTSETAGGKKNNNKTKQNKKLKVSRRKQIIKIRAERNEGNNSKG